MKDPTKKPPGTRSGFTLAEFLVLIGVAAFLSGLLAADLNQTKSKLLQQACAANIKQWGMAFYLYSQDYNGTLFYDVAGVHWDDGSNNPPNPYLRYLGEGDLVAKIRTMRVCPARPGAVSVSGTTHSYSMPIGRYRKGLNYQAANVSGSPFYDGFNYWPNLKSVPKPAQYLLLLDSSGNTANCGNLHSLVTTSGTSADTLPPIQRHLALINCLFGDYHAEALPIEKIDAMDGNCTSANPPNYTFALN